MEALRTLLAAGLANPIGQGEGEDPGRHWFLCRVPGEPVGTSGQDALPTHDFRVIACRDDPGEPWRIITAYPEPEP